MQILSLHLENVKSYEDCQVEFAEGVNAIVGHNGAGKSTILEAIGFALFDYLPYTQSSFVRAGAKIASVTVTFRSDVDERVYRVVRRCGSSTQHYLYDPELDARICEGKADVLSFLRHHLGVEGDTDLASLFADAVGVSQGTFTAAFLETPARRKGIFDRLLRVEEYQRTFERLLEPLQRLGQRMAELDVTLAGLESRLARLPELTEAMAQRRQEIQQRQQRLTEVQARLETVVAQRADLEAVRHELTGLQQQLAQAEQRLQGVEEQLAGARQAHAEARAARALVQAHQADHDRYLAAQARQQELETQVQARQALRDRCARLENLRGELEVRLQLLQQEQETIAEAQATLAALAESVARQAALEEALAAARQRLARLEDARAEVARQEERLRRLQDRAAALEQQLAQAQALEEQRRELEARLEALRQQLDEIRQEQARCKAEADPIRRQNEALAEASTARCPVCEQPLTPEHREQLLGRNQARLDSLRQEYSRLQQQGRDAQQTLRAEEARLRQLQDTLQRLPRPAELAEMQQEIQASQEVVATAQARVTELAQAANQVEALTAELQALGDPRQRQAVAASRAAQADQVARDLAAVSEQLAARQQELVDLEAELQAFAGLDDALAEVATQLRTFASAYEVVLANRKLAQQVEERRAQIQALEEARGRLLEERMDVTVRLEAVQARFDEEEFQALGVEEQELRQELGSLQTAIELLTQQQAEDEAQVQELRALEVQQQEAVSRRAHLARLREILETMRKLLREAGPFITEALVRQIGEGAAQIFGEIMQDYTRHLAWTKDYGIILEVDGHEREFAQLSGGEQMSAALSVRLALLREMSNIDVAFFDEPTANLDEARRSALAQQILQVRGFRQLFVISHDDTFEQATQHLIRVERVNGTSTVHSL